MLDILMKGGVILWVIILLSFIGAAIIIERLLYFKKTRADEDKLFNRIKATVEKKHYDEALFICESTVSPFTRLMKTGIEHRNYPKLIQKEVLQEAANQEIPHLEKSLSFLGSIAHISPLLGLLGTVTGNIQAFGVLGSFGAVSDP
ncbi:MAG: MotA/TolQ/ExbB proton channel family protein, partial [Spirochaetaceae bacterium]|nr:MotA/TolQ/ExbB proton channel family protein [Spirochaetaceae bacterium]